MRAQAMQDPLKSLEEEGGAWSAVAYIPLSPKSLDPFGLAGTVVNLKTDVRAVKH